MTTVTNGKATELITFTRGTLATVTDADGKIKWAPHNLLTNSEQFDASVWGKYLATVSANTQVAPNGTTTADTVTALSGNDVHRVQRSSDVAIGAPANCSFSIFVKAGTHNFVTIGFYSASEVFVSATFNLASGSVATETDVGTTSGTVVSTEKVDVGNSWFRLSITGNYSGSSVLSFVNFAQAATGNSYTNFGQPVANLVGTETFHLWGAHLYRSDLGGMQANASAYPMYNPSTPKNLAAYTEAFDVTSSGWAKGNTTVSANATSSPTGLSGADLLYPSSTGSNRQIYRSTSGLTSGTRYTASIYVKSAGLQWIGLLSPNGANYGVYFDILNGVKGTEASGVTGTITPMGDGWYRCSVSQVSSGTEIYYGVSLADADNSTTVTANGTSGIYLWGAQLSDSASLDAYSPVFGAAPSAAAYHGPRLDFDPVTLSAKGLLVEEARTNLALRSEEFNDSAWQKYDATITANAAISPNGTATADKVVPNNVSTDYHGFQSQSAVTVTSGVDYTWSCYVKADGYNWFGMVAYTGGTSFISWFNLSSGTIGTSAAGNTAAITSVGNGWYRVSVKRATGNTTAYFIARVANADNAPTFIGDGTSGILIWGAQLELGSFPTSYIPTAAATVTRNADVASVGVSQFPYSATEGTLVVSASTVNNQNISAYFAHLASAAAGTSYGSSHAILKGGSSGIAAGQKVKGITYDDTNSATGEVATTGDINTAVIKVAYAFAANDFRVSVNGDSVISDTGGAMPSAASILMLGAMRPGSAGYYLSGHIRQITYLPRRLTNAELQSRTA